MKMLCRVPKIICFAKDLPRFHSTWTLNCVYLHDRSHLFLLFRKKGHQREKGLQKHYTKKEYLPNTLLDSITSVIPNVFKEF